MCGGQATQPRIDKDSKKVTVWREKRGKGRGQNRTKRSGNGTGGTIILPLI